MTETPNLPLMPCVNCGEFYGGAYEIENGPGPFCEDCWERLEAYFTPRVTFSDTTTFLPHQPEPGTTQESYPLHARDEHGRCRSWCYGCERQGLIERVKFTADYESLKENANRPPSGDPK